MLVLICNDTAVRLVLQLVEKYFEKSSLKLSLNLTFLKLHSLPEKSRVNTFAVNGYSLIRKNFKNFINEFIITIHRIIDIIYYFLAFKIYPLIFQTLEE